MDLLLRALLYSISGVSAEQHAHLGVRRGISDRMFPASSGGHLRQLRHSLSLPVPVPQSPRNRCRRRIRSPAKDVCSCSSHCCCGGVCRIFHRQYLCRVCKVDGIPPARSPLDCLFEDLRSTCEKSCMGINYVVYSPYFAANNICSDL